MKKILACTLLAFSLVSCSNMLPKGGDSITSEILPTITQTNPPHPTGITTITPTEDPAPVFPESGTMRSEHLTVSLSQRWMELAEIREVSLDPKILEQVYQVMVVHWAASLASFSNDAEVLAFTDHYVCDVDDRGSGFNFSVDLPKAHLKNAQQAYKLNSQKGDPFDYSFDFGQGVFGTVEAIEIKALANQQEYQYIEQQLKQQEEKFVNVYGRDDGTRKSDDKAMFFYDTHNVLHVYTWDGNPHQKKYLDLSQDRSYALFADLFFYTQVNGGVAILRTNDRRYTPQCAGYSLHEALGCVDYYCNQSGRIPSNFIITLTNGKTISPPAINSESVILTPVPKVIQASNKPIDIYYYSIYFSNVDILDVGSNPLGLDSNLALSIIFTEPYGDNQKLREFSQLPVWFADESGSVIENVLVQRLEPQNGMNYYRWIVYIDDPSKAYFLHAMFPTGEEIVDFSPLLH